LAPTIIYNDFRGEGNENNRRRNPAQPRPVRLDKALPMTESDRKRTKVFVSYSHEDALWLNRLKVHMQPLIRGGLVDFWDDTKIQAGMDWRAAIREAIGSARVAGTRGLLWNGRYLRGR
jgi:hypothetical protein